MKNKLKIIGLLALALRTSLPAHEDPPDCHFPVGRGNASQSGINFNLLQAHIGDRVPVFPNLGMLDGACRATGVTGSIWTAASSVISLTNFLINVTLDPGVPFFCPSPNTNCQPGPYLVTITPAMVSAPVHLPPIGIILPGAPKSVRAAVVSEGTVHSLTHEQLGGFNTATISIVTPCIRVVQQYAYPPATNCLEAGVPIAFTGYVTNCGDIRLTNVALIHSRTASLLTTNGEPLVQPLALNVGQVVGFQGSFTATSAEICAGSASSDITARGTDTTIIGGPNASVTNSVTGSCSICPVTCGPVVSHATWSYGGGFSFSFATAAGRTNTVEYTESLLPANWQALTNFLGDGGSVIITDPVAAQGRFYRVLVQ